MFVDAGGDKFFIENWGSFYKVYIWDVNHYTYFGSFSSVAEIGAFLEKWNVF